MSSNWRSPNTEAIVAHPLMAAEIAWHRKTTQLEREIKRLRSEVGLMAKRYHGAQREINDMVTRLRAQPTPPVPLRGPPPPTEEEKEEEREEEKETEEKGEEEEGDPVEDEEMEDSPPPPLPPNTAPETAQPEPLPHPPPTSMPPTTRPPTPQTPPVPVATPPKFYCTEKDYVNPLSHIDLTRAHWTEIFEAHHIRWKEAIEKIKRLGSKYPALAERMGEVEDLQDRDATELRPWEKIMMDCFIERNLSELDKRCWLVVETYATVEQDQIPRVREGLLPQIVMKQEEKEKGTVEEPEEMEVEEEDMAKPLPGMMSHEIQCAGPPTVLDELELPFFPLGRRKGPPPGGKRRRPRASLVIDFDS